MKIFAARLFDGVAFRSAATLSLEAGRITAITPGDDAADIRLSHGFLGPGLIDLHHNGAFGVDCATAEEADWDRLVSQLAAHGVTGVLPTIITAPLPALRAAATRLRAAMLRHPGLLGLHLEGPFLAPEKRGAHQAAWLRLPDAAALDALLDADMRAVLRVLTLAPELPHALAAIARLRALGVAVSLGHTNADAGQMQAAAAAGARLVTHLFNAQSPLSHRAPGAPGVALTETLLSPCVIADGVHVDPLLLRIAFAACPRAIAVTDSIPLAGLPAGSTLAFGGAPATLAPDGVGRRADGTIAGAAITLDEGVRRLIAAGVPAETALAATTSRPAAALGLQAGRLAPGFLADLVWWSDDVHALQVWQAGRSAGLAGTPRTGTETPRPELQDLETRDTEEILRLFMAQERHAQQALAQAMPALARLAEAVAARLREGGRLFYAGAGTSGRLGLLDAVECRPTFGIEPGLIIPLLAGGESAFLEAAEGAEDDEDQARLALAGHGFGPRDALIGIAASGTTPFTLAALREAAARGGLTGAILNNPGAAMARAAQIAVEIASGPEIIAGSTRLSAGSTQKIALNLLSSAVMIRLGKTYGPFMVDMRASNAKLRRRALAMVQRISQADEERCRLALAACDMHVKPAALMLMRDLSAPAALDLLARHGGSLRRALDEDHVREETGNLGGQRNPHGQKG